MTNEIKLCVNCRWYQETQYTDECLYSGTFVGYCDPCRSHDGHCKPQAIHWEPRSKLTIFERIKRSIEV